MSRHASLKKNQTTTKKHPTAVIPIRIASGDKGKNKIDI